MHSRIYQISKTPVDMDDYIDEEKYYDHWFTNSVADYVDGDTDRENDIKWFVKFLKSKDMILESNDESFTLGENVREKYFKEKYDALKECMENMSFKKFCSDSLALYKIQMHIEDKYDFYIHHDGAYQTIDNFMRNVEDGQTWYFGGILDYHF